MVKAISKKATPNHKIKSCLGFVFSLNKSTEETKYFLLISRKTYDLADLLTVTEIHLIAVQKSFAITEN